MTNKEALIASVTVSVSDTAIEKGLIDGDIDGSETYSKANQEIIDLAAIKILEGAMVLADISEGDYSIKYNYKAIEARLTTLKGIYFPIVAKRPTVKAFNGW